VISNQTIQTFSKFKVEVMNKQTGLAKKNRLNVLQNKSKAQAAKAQVQSRRAMSEIRKCKASSKKA
jgi:hypothetical protein